VRKVIDRTHDLSPESSKIVNTITELS
jgi:hypothetical protein